MPALKSKRAVWESSDSTAHTGGKLYKRHLMKNKAGKIVSKRKHEAGKRMYRQNNLHPKTASQMKELRAMRRRK